MQPNAASRYHFGNFTVDKSRACLLCADNAVALRPKSFDVLEYLVTHAGRVVSKDELLSAIWPNVVVTEDSLTRCISEVRAALGDSTQRVIKTVTRRGYIFAEPVTTLDPPRLPGQPPTALAPAVVPLGRPLAYWRALAGAVLLLIGLILTYGLTRDRGPAVPRLSMVVLPFANLGADPTQDYIADVITNDLTIALSRLRGATVIAPGSAFTFKGAMIEPQQLGSQLGVRYAVQGSVLRNEGQLRISARLIDIQNPTPLWSDQFDVPRADLLLTQDVIVTRLANALDAQLVQADSRRSYRSGPRSLDAEDLAMQCDAVWFRLGVKAEAPSYELCEQALRIDPRNLRALVRLAAYHANRVSRVQSPNPPADIARANELVARALEVDPDDYAAHCAKALTLEGENRIRDAIASAERCLVLNPSHAGAYSVLVNDYFFLAQPHKVIEFADRGIRISPLDPLMPKFLLFKGWAYLMMGQDEDALLWMRRAHAASPETPTILAGLTSVLALTGHDAEARAALGRYLALKDTQTRTIAQWNHRPDDNDAFKQFDARFKSGLRVAGMQEQ